MEAVTEGDHAVGAHFAAVSNELIIVGAHDDLGASVAIYVHDDGILRSGARGVGHLEEHPARASMIDAEKALIVVDHLGSSIGLEVEDARARCARGMVLRVSGPEDAVDPGRRAVDEPSRRSAIGIEDGVGVARCNADLGEPIEVEIRDRRRTAAVSAETLLFGFRQQPLEDRCPIGAREDMDHPLGDDHDLDRAIAAQVTNGSETLAQGFTRPELRTVDSAQRGASRDEIDHAVVADVIERGDERTTSVAGVPIASQGPVVGDESATGRDHRAPINEFWRSVTIEVDDCNSTGVERGGGRSHGVGPEEGSVIVEERETTIG